MNPRQLVCVRVHKQAIGHNCEVDLLLLYGCYGVEFMHLPQVAGHNSWARAIPVRVCEVYRRDKDGSQTEEKLPSTMTSNVQLVYETPGLKPGMKRHQLDQAEIVIFFSEDRCFPESPTPTAHSVSADIIYHPLRARLESLFTQIQGESTLFIEVEPAPPSQGSVVPDVCGNIVQLEKNRLKLSPQALYARLSRVYVDFVNGYIDSDHDFSLYAQAVSRDIADFLSAEPQYGPLLRELLGQTELLLAEDVASELFSAIEEKELDLPRLLRQYKRLVPVKNGQRVNSALGIRSENFLQRPNEAPLEGIKYDRKLNLWARQLRGERLKLDLVQQQRMGELERAEKEAKQRLLAHLDEMMEIQALDLRERSKQAQDDLHEKIELLNASSLRRRNALKALRHARKQLAEIPAQESEAVEDGLTEDQRSMLAEDLPEEPVRRRLTRQVLDLVEEFAVADRDLVKVSKECDDARTLSKQYVQEESQHDARQRTLAVERREAKKALDLVLQEKEQIEAEDQEGVVGTLSAKQLTLQVDIQDLSLEEEEVDGRQLTAISASEKGERIMVKPLTPKPAVSRQTVKISGDIVDVTVPRRQPRAMPESEFVRPVGERTQQLMYLQSEAAAFMLPASRKVQARRGGIPLVALPILCCCLPCFVLAAPPVLCYRLAIQPCFRSLTWRRVHRYAEVCTRTLKKLFHSDPTKRQFDDLFADQETAFKYLSEFVARWLPSRDLAFYALPLPPSHVEGKAATADKQAWWRLCWSKSDNGTVKLVEMKHGSAMIHHEEIAENGGEINDPFTVWKAEYNTLKMELMSSLPAIHTFLSHWFVGVVFLIPFVSIATVVIFLPAFFLLLVARTTTVEAEDTKFVDRQQVIRQEPRRKHQLRMARFLARTLPMFGFCVIWPLLLGLYVLPSASFRTQQTLIGLHFFAVLLLQGLGTVRAGQSWIEKMTLKAKEELAESRKSVQPQVDVEEQPADDVTPTRHKPAQFAELNWTNVNFSLSMLIEFVQMAAFPLQASGDHKTATPDWANTMFDTVYLSFLSKGVETMSWASVVAVAVLVLLFARQFIIELRTYGLYLTHSEKHGDGSQLGARKYFFNTLTGAVVFGHGKASFIGANTRALVNLLSNTLFLTISFHLVQPLVCDKEGHLVADSDTECWQGSHRWLGAACLVSLTFYICLSVMLAPMLACSEGSPSPVAFVKAYLMFVVMIQTAMVVASALFGSAFEETKSVALGTLVSSVALLIGTTRWVSWAESFYGFHSELFPCAMPLANWWKLAIYCVGVLSASVVLLWSYLQDLPLMAVLLPAWILLFVSPFAIHFLKQRTLAKKSFVRGTSHCARRDGRKVHPALLDPALYLPRTMGWSEISHHHT